MRAADLAVFYDVDDTLWSVNPCVAREIGIDHELLDEFRTRENTHLTAAQIEKVIAGYSAVETYETAPFFDGVEKILDLENELGVKVRIVSNSYSPEVAEIKRRRLLERIPGLTEEHLFLHVTSPEQTHKKVWPFAPTVLVDDSPYNVASSQAIHNFVPKMCYNSTEKAMGIMRDKTFSYVTYGDLAATFKDVREFMLKQICR